jgi:flagellar biosynthetic protein FlhB
VLFRSVLGLIDYGVRRWQFERSLRMTPQEMREEMRQYEGDPRIRDRRRAIQRRLAMERMINRVPRATVIMTSPDGAAVAIEYDLATADTPRVAAKGVGAIARQILDAAHENGVPIVESAAAAALYRKGDVGAAVPGEQYKAVADAVAFAMAAGKRTVQA